VSFVLIYKDHYYADSEHRLPVGRTLQSTQGSPIDHIAFSYENIAPELDSHEGRWRNDRAADCRSPRRREELFIAGPDAVSIEIVEAKPIPDGLWR
jgi:hypothetical protein